MSRSLGADVVELLARLNAVFPALGTEVTDADEARRRFDAIRRPPATPTPVGAVRDESIDGPGGGRLGLRWYQPAAAPPAGHGTVVFLHGGGWVLGGLDSHDELVRKLVAGSGVPFVAVDYRLAPEHPFPAALHDARAALRHVAARAGGPVVVAGDSAGAALATAVCAVARDEGGPAVAGQVLLYPVTDGAADSASYAENATGFYITAEHLRWFWRQYLRDPADAADPLAAPLRSEALGGLPPAHVVTAELDPLRDEGEAYAAKLAAAGVPVTARRYDGVFHGFLAFDEQLPAARDGQRDVCRRIVQLAGAEVT